MAPPKKKLKALSDEKVMDSEPEPDPALLDDHRISWLLASEKSFVEVRAQGERFRVHKAILCRHSDYFNACLNKPFREASAAAVALDDVDPRSLALFLGVAYSYASIVPHARPAPSPRLCLPAGERNTLRDYIEVFKLSDRFVSDDIGRFMLQCINATIGDRHSALFRSSSCPSASKEDPEAGTSRQSRQSALMREFADGYEALETAHDAQAVLAARIIEYFCGGVDYLVWSERMDELMDRPRFVAMVSKAFARQLSAASGKRSRLKRKELAAP